MGYEGWRDFDCFVDDASAHKATAATCCLQVSPATLMLILRRRVAGDCFRSMIWRQGSRCWLMADGHYGGQAARCRCLMI